MRALSIHQPYADLIIARKKIYEIRSWQTNYRGKILICSTKNPYHKNKLCGYALGIAELFSIEKMKPSHCELAHIEFIENVYAWQLSNIKKIKPFPIKGQQGLFNINHPNIENLLSND
jgi:hypothetical protein